MAYIYCVEIFLMTQAAHQTKLPIKIYKRSKFGQTWSKCQKVKVKRGTIVRVTHGMSVQLTWQSVELALGDVARLYRLMANMWAN